jgi:hypothetical protein
MISDAVHQFKEDCLSRSFPTEQESFHVDPAASLMAVSRDGDR